MLNRTKILVASLFTVSFAACATDPLDDDAETSAGDDHAAVRGLEWGLVPIDDNCAFDLDADGNELRVLGCDFQTDDANVTTGSVLVLREGPCEGLACPLVLDPTGERLAFFDDRTTPAADGPGPLPNVLPGGTSILIDGVTLPRATSNTSFVIKAVRTADGRIFAIDSDLRLMHARPALILH